VREPLGHALGHWSGQISHSVNISSRARTEMAIGGGSSEWSGEPGDGGESSAASGVGRCANASAAGRGMEGFVELGGEAEVAAPPLPPPSPSRPDSEKWWTSGGRTSMNDPMSHYLYNGSE
jgi:hypothetical protein